MFNIAVGVLLGLLAFGAVFGVGVRRMALPLLAVVLLASGNEVVGGLLALALVVFWVSFAIGRWQERRRQRRGCA